MKTRQFYDVQTNRFLKSISLIFIAAALALISACAVKYTADYYRPQAAGGKVVRSAPQPHERSTILFERDGVTIGVLTQYYERERLA